MVQRKDWPLEVLPWEAKALDGLELPFRELLRWFAIASRIYAHEFWCYLSY
jgi:hypothetical protein